MLHKFHAKHTLLQRKYLTGERKAVNSNEMPELARRFILVSGIWLGGVVYKKFMIFKVFGVYLSEF